MSIATYMHSHHFLCDGRFADAEEAGRRGDWPRAEVLLGEFRGELEAHFTSEETLLFPAFEAATGMTEGPTRVMRGEHAQMRDLVAQMTQALARKDGDAFAGAAETLLVFMQQHNMKEEHILYPMCDRNLPPSMADALRERLGDACVA